MQTGRLGSAFEQRRIQLVEALHDALMADIGKGLLRQADQYTGFHAAGTQLALHVGQYLGVSGGGRAGLIHGLRLLLNKIRRSVSVPDSLRFKNIHSQLPAQCRALIHRPGVIFPDYYKGHTEILLARLKSSYQAESNTSGEYNRRESCPMKRSARSRAVPARTA